MNGGSTPRFARGMKLSRDAARDRWVVMGPERMFVPDDIALEILKLVDGLRSIDAITDDLAARFAAPRRRCNSGIKYGSVCKAASTKESQSSSGNGSPTSEKERPAAADKGGEAQAQVCAIASPQHGTAKM